MHPVICHQTLKMNVQLYSLAWNTYNHLRLHSMNYSRTTNKRAWDSLRVPNVAIRHTVHKSLKYAMANPKAWFERTLCSILADAKQVSRSGQFLDGILSRKSITLFRCSWKCLELCESRGGCMGAWFCRIPSFCEGCCVKCMHAQNEVCRNGCWAVFIPTWCVSMCWSYQTQLCGIKG